LRRSKKDKVEAEAEAKVKAKSTSKNVIPAKTGIQENTGFRVKPGMTN
jgi:hypothetical protein